MNIWQHKIDKGDRVNPEVNTKANLVLVFGDQTRLTSSIIVPVSAAYPSAQIVYCSTAGEIMAENVYENTICITAIEWEKTGVKTSLINMRAYSDSISAGRGIVSNLTGEGLKHILVFADGQLVNGSDLVLGMNEMLPPHVTISGGLAGDGPRFEKTLVGLNDNLETGNIVAVGLYGDSLQLCYSSRGGWDSFGPDRKITKSTANVLYELDGKSALSLYKKYLGDLEAKLPASALLFPLSIRVGKHTHPLVRTILSINEEEQSMTFAGNVPEGSYARLMKANFDRLIDAAADAGRECLDLVKQTSPELVLLVSCVGRRLVLDQRTEEEIESIRQELGKETMISGFYSYGEISPLGYKPGCELYNQTMTITSFRER